MKPISQKTICKKHNYEGSYCLLCSQEAEQQYADDEAVKFVKWLFNNYTSYEIFMVPVKSVAMFFSEYKEYRKKFNSLTPPVEDKQ